MVVSIDDHQSPILDHHARLRSAARGVPGVHRQRDVTDVRRTGSGVSSTIARHGRRCSRRVESLSHRDPRIRVVHRSTNGGIVAASNDALSMARGEFIALLDHDDGLVPTALEQMAATIDAAGEVDYLYSDEAHVLADGRESAHFLKPDWSPERFRSSMYTCHLSALRRDVVTEVGGFRPGFDGSQDHDLILRATEVIAARGRRVVHLPSLLYHWRNISSSVSRATSSLNNAVERGRQAVQEQCDRLGVDATRGARSGGGHLSPATNRADRHADHRGGADTCRGWGIAPLPTRCSGDDRGTSHDASHHAFRRRLPGVVAHRVGGAARRRRR